MRNPLQEQLLKAGLVKKSQVAQVVREQAKQRHGKAPLVPTAEQVEAERLRLEKAERDRALAAERNAQAKLQEQRAQVRQIVQQNRVPVEGEIAYNFADGGAIRTIWIDAPLRAQLASGSLVVVRHDQGYALIPRAAADKVYARDAAMVVLDHARSSTDSTDSDDEYYKRFQVPDDLIW